MGCAVHAQQADCGRDWRLRSTRRAPLQRNERFERALVADFSQCQHGIVLQRPIELCDADEGLHGVSGLVVAKRFDHCTTEEVHTAVHVDEQRLANFLDRPRGCSRSHGADQGRPDELGLLASGGFEQRRRHRRVGCMLEIVIGDLTQPIVRVGQHLSHHVLCARIVEPGEQHQRAETNKAIGVLRRRPNQCRHGCGGRRPADCPPCVHPNVVFELAQVRQRRLQFLGETVSDACAERPRIDAIPHTKTVAINPARRNIRWELPVVNGRCVIMERRDRSLGCPRASG